MTQKPWIAVDWGSSNLRLWLLSQSGEVIANRASDQGMGQLGPDQFEPVLLTLVEDIVEQGPCDVVICGMAGAKQGWIDAGYAQVPCPPVSPNATLAPTLNPRLRVHILPGLCQLDPPDVMRGEETQIAGYLLQNPDFEGVICLPGTHSKWAQISQGKVTGFQSFLTGELFALLSTQSILRHSVQSPDWDGESFLKALTRSFEDPHHAFADLFQLRANSLLNSGATATAAKAALSGALIGHELGAAWRWWHDQPVTLIGAETLCDLYAQALTHLGAKPTRVDPEDMTLSGLKAAYHRLQQGMSR